MKSNLDIARECGAKTEYPRGFAGDFVIFDCDQLDDFAERIRADERLALASSAPIKPVALPAGMPEPDAYMFQHEETGLVQFVDAQQVEWGFEQNNPRLKRIDAVYTAAQVRAMLAQGLAPGWRAVPAEDTPSMWTAGGKAIKNCAGHSRDAASLAYKAMLAAAPQPQQIAEPASRATPSAKGIYAWVPENGSPALLLVNKRPSSHSPGGILNAHVLQSPSFYDGCAVSQWGPGCWILLRNLEIKKEPS